MFVPYTLTLLCRCSKQDADVQPLDRQIEDLIINHTPLFLALATRADRHNLLVRRNRQSHPGLLGQARHIQCPQAP
jgi:hypothetical protein